MQICIHMYTHTLAHTHAHMNTQAHTQPLEHSSILSSPSLSTGKAGSRLNSASGAFGTALWAVTSVAPLLGIRDQMPSKKQPGRGKVTAILGGGGVAGHSAAPEYVAMLAHISVEATMGHWQLGDTNPKATPPHPQRPTSSYLPTIPQPSKNSGLQLGTETHKPVGDILYSNSSSHRYVQSKFR